MRDVHLQQLNRHGGHYAPPLGAGEQGRAQVDPDNACAARIERGVASRADSRVQTRPDKPSNNNGLIRR